LSTKNRLRQKVVQYYKSLLRDIFSCVVMFYLILFYSILTF